MGPHDARVDGKAMRAQAKASVMNILRVGWNRKSRRAERDSMSRLDVK